MKTPVDIDFCEKATDKNNKKERKENKHMQRAQMEYKQQINKEESWQTEENDKRCCQNGKYPMGPFF